jgi:hypothetical protein
MFTGQLNRIDSSEFANQLSGRCNLALAADSEAAFALLYSKAPGLASPSAGDTKDLGIRGTIDNGFGLPITDDYGGALAEYKLIPGQTDASGEENWQSLLLDYKHLSALGLGTRERQFNDQDNELESPRSHARMGRLTSQNRTAQIEPVSDNPSTIPQGDRQPETSATVSHRSQIPALAFSRAPLPCTRA